MLFHEPLMRDPLEENMHTRERERERETNKMRYSEQEREKARKERNEQLPDVNHEPSQSKTPSENQDFKSEASPLKGLSKAF